MKRTLNPYCQLCSPSTTSTFFHMVWKCPQVLSFWKTVVNRLSSLLGVTIPCSPVTVLLNDFSGLNLSMKHRRFLLLGLTAAKKMVAQRWKGQCMFSCSYNCFLFVCFCFLLLLFVCCCFVGFVSFLLLLLVFVVIVYLFVCLFG